MMLTVCLAMIFLGCPANLQPVGRLERSKRCIGCDDTTVGEHHWMVSIYNTRNRHVCGGTLIADKWVLTAGHCLMEKMHGYLRKHPRVTDFKVIAGHVNRNSTTRQEGGIERVKIHGWERNLMGRNTINDWCYGYCKRKFG